MHVRLRFVNLRLLTQAITLTTIRCINFELTLILEHNAQGKAIPTVNPRQIHVWHKTCSCQPKVMQ